MRGFFRLVRACSHGARSCKVTLNEAGIFYSTIQITLLLLNNSDPIIPEAPDSPFYCNRAGLFVASALFDMKIVINCVKWEEVETFE